MSNDCPEILSAFVDGETVDPRELAEALQLPGALDSLRQFVGLRAEAQEMQDRPGADFYAAMERVIPSTREHEPWWRRVIPIPMPALAAAAVAAMALVAWIGLTDPSTVDLVAGPPKPDRIVHFEPGVDWKFQDSEPQARNRSIDHEKLDDSNDFDRNGSFALALAGGERLAVRRAAIREHDPALRERRRRHGDEG